MNKISTKRLFLYLSIPIVLSYFAFVLVMYSGNQLKELYTLAKCGFYYIVIYLLLAATTYIIDIQTRKEPGYLTIYCLPVFTILFLLGFILMSSVNNLYIIVLLAIMTIILVVGHLVYKKWMNKLSKHKNWYENILFIYVILHLFLSLFISFKIIEIL